MSAFGGKAEVLGHPSKGPGLAIFGHAPILNEKRTANACEAFDPEYLRDGAFAPFVRPTPQSDPWRRDRGRIVS